MVKVITPDDGLIDDEDRTPTVFLAGPIQGAPNWHEDAIKCLTELAGDMDLYIANPKIKYLDDRFVYADQVDWETAMLNHTASSGSGLIMFWLAKEQDVIEGRAYAQTTRFELAEWLAYSQIVMPVVKVGIEEGFVGERYIRHRLGKRQSPYNDLKSLCEATIQEIKRYISTE